MSDSHLPEVKILHAFKVSDPGDTFFEYPNMTSQIETQRPYINDRWDKIEQASEGSIELADPARALAMFYMIKTADKLVAANTISASDIWSERFTQASIELYGQPADNEVSILAKTAIHELTDTKSQSAIDAELVETVTRTYGTLIGPEASAATEIADDTEVARSCREFLEQEYTEVFNLIDTDKEYSPPEMLATFNKAIKILVQRDSNWKGWEAELRPQGNLEVDGEEHRVLVGERRQPVRGKKFVGLLAHELLVHAQRRVRAERHDDITLQRGLPEYLTAEEGLGIFTDYVLTGEVPQTIQDRYTDIALALGSDDRMPLTRTELFEFVKSRTILREHLKSEEINETKINKSSWQHIYRIFRGGSGHDQPGTPAVFTKPLLTTMAL